MSEPVPLIDTHVHMWDRTDSSLRYDFLDPQLPHPLLSPEERERLGVPIYGAEQLTDDLSAAGIAATVHVQAAVGIEDPVMETLWLERQRDFGGQPTVIVGHVDLARQDVAAQLERHLAASSAFVGVRDSGDGSDYLCSPDWRRGVGELVNRDLVCCLDVTAGDMNGALAVAYAFPEGVFVVDHMGLPLPRDREFFRFWQREMRLIARAPNVYCKISEQTLVNHRWDAEDAQMWMAGCLEAFGPYRCFFGSNWPVDSLHVDYVTLADSYRRLTNALSSDERNAMNTRTAAQVFRVAI